MFRYPLYLFGLTFLAWTAYTSLTQVRSHERAVIRRFGRVLPDKPQQGLYIGMPWGIDRVDLVPVGRVRTIVIGFDDKADKDPEVVPAGQLVTGDHNVVNIRASVNFKVAEKDMEQYVLQQNNVDAFVARAAEGLLAEWVAGRKVDEVLRQGKNELPRFLHDHLQDRIQDYILGIEIEQTSITRLDPPDEVKLAFDKLAQAQTNIRTQINQAEESANSERDNSKGRVKAIQDQTKTYIREEQKNARTEAANFSKRLALYRELSQKTPDYLNVLWRDDMTRLYTAMKEAGRIELLDHFLTSEGLSITQFPLQPKRK